MTRYRRRFEIIADILRVAEKGAKKTRIMYIANLSYKLLVKYLAETIKAGLICARNDGYELTEKGRSFLGAYSQFHNQHSRVQKELELLRSEVKVLERMCALAGNPETKKSGSLRRRDESPY